MPQENNLPSPLPSDPLWYKDAIIYELHVRAFYDSDGDGIGDFKGLLQKLDYLQDLGVNAIWLLPFYPSPLKDDGYDIGDYTKINSMYGDLKSFKQFLRAAHDRGIRVITELVINHTSDQHEWFQKSRHAPPGSYWRNFYVWTDNPRKYKETRIIFKDFEMSNWTWDPVAKAYYWHRFYHHQPDLNFDNPEVVKRIYKVLDMWMEMGVDGMRLDAVPYLFEREGTSCENLPETHRYLKSLRAYIDSKYKDRMILAEANQWPEDAVAYFGDGDECHMNFHFPLMPRLFMALKMEDRFSIIDILRQTPEIPDNCQWATFLRNHDELTLEMVTDEERDYMYKAYAAEPQARINLGIRRRLAPLLGNDRRQIELLNGLLFSLPGTPVIYYGDEIGMGDNIFLGDRNGVRTPFQWSPDRNAGFSKANPQSLYLPTIISPEYHYETVNVETQQNNPNSLLWWMKNLIEMRKQHVALSRGKLRFLEPDNPRVLAFIREYEDEETGEDQRILVVCNLSKKTQYVELDLSEFKGLVPTELVGHTAFPPLGDLPYFITLGPYGFYWFALTHQKSLDSSQWLLRDKVVSKMPNKPFEALTQPVYRELMEERFAQYLPKARWFAGKDEPITRTRIRDVVFVPYPDGLKKAALVVLDVQYKKKAAETYLITMTYTEGERADFIQAERPDLVIGDYVNPNNPKQKGIYHEAILDSGFGTALLEHVLRRRKKDGEVGSVAACTYTTIKREWLQDIPEPSFTSLEQSNSSLRFGKRHYLKLFRRFDEGPNPEIEIGAHFSTRAPFANATHLVGSLMYEYDGKEYALGVVHEYVEAQRSAWDLFVDHISHVADPVSTLSEEEGEDIYDEKASFFGYKSKKGIPTWFRENTNYTSSLMTLLGKRTGEMHSALASDDKDKDFRPEDITPFYQRSLYQSLRNRASRVHSELLENRKLPEDAQELVGNLLTNWDRVLAHFEAVRQEALGGKLIRIHGDYHLGQVLFTGKDFVILDFEGEPLRSVSERRLKRSPLQDVGGMLRSIDYAMHYYLREKVYREADRERLSPWLRMWRQRMCNRFLDGYMGAVSASLLPETSNKVRLLTEVYLLEKALYEVEYELASRPDWVSIPLRGLRDVIPTLLDVEKEGL
ncbi:MAG: maltose alpha-D-glucosyltransferase [Alphaproteobacteria bacterium]|nr:maltose alpha-D-glucosyltransferase [Alphaproteobacteria bacterium]